VQVTQVRVDPGDPRVVGGALGLQENGDLPLCLLPALRKPKRVFSVRLDGTLERTDDYLSGWVSVAEGFKSIQCEAVGKPSFL